MKNLWKNYSDEFKRRYQIIFEYRDLEVIRKDYYDHKWISKDELQKLMEYEIRQLFSLYNKEKEEKNFILEGFNLATMRNYYELEEKSIKSGRKL